MELDMRIELTEAAIVKALEDALIGGYDILDTPAGITLIGPAGEGHGRDIFVVQVLPAKVMVA
jgi:hypothetical protein